MLTLIPHSNTAGYPKQENDQQDCIALAAGEAKPICFRYLTLHAWYLKQGQGFNISANSEKVSATPNK